MKQFEIFEADGLVIYDESDDYSPDEVVDSEFHLMTNEEIFTDEYMENYAREMDAKIVREKQSQRMISVGVILASLIFVFILIAIFF